ncbi:MAG: hypothetical protein R3E58_19165 [Phycisphaerae bacterium]
MMEAAGTLTIGAGSDVVSDQTALLRRGTIDVLGGRVYDEHT